MRRISPKTLIKLTRFFYSKIIPYLPKSSNRGMPKTYPDHQIISMLLIKEVYQLSFRETILLSRDYFKRVPSLRDFHYRASKLMHVIQFLIKFIHDYMQRGCVQTIIVDGTGIGFRKKTNLNWMRGTQVRKVKDHKEMFGNVKGKLSGYVAAYREDMAMVLALVKFLAYNMYVVYFLSLFLVRLWPVYLLLSISLTDF